MILWSDEMTGLIVSTAISLLLPYLIYALERYLKLRLDAAARDTTVYGGDFSYSYYGDVCGTLETMANKLHGRTLWEASDINRSASWVQELLDRGDADGLMHYVLSGRDVIHGSGQGDVIVGLAGSDVLDGRGGNDALYGDAGSDVLSGGIHNDTLDGGQGGDRLSGNAGNDLLIGGSGNDVLSGGWGRDVLVGGAGADGPSGGHAADTFQFRSTAEAGLGASSDAILDFDHGDRIDLRAIDANETLRGDQAFSYIWGGRFSGDGGELRFAGGVLSGDTDGDRMADFSIRVSGEDALFKFDLLV